MLSMRLVSDLILTGLMIKGTLSLYSEACLRYCSNWSLQQAARAAVVTSR